MLVTTRVGHVNIHISGKNSSLCKSPHLHGENKASTGKCPHSSNKTIVQYTLYMLIKFSGNSAIM